MAGDTSVAVGPDTIPQALRDVIGGGEVARLRFSLGGVPQLAVGIPLPAVEGAYFEIFPLLELDRTLSVLRNSLAAAAAATILAGAIVGRWVTRRVLAPVAEVSSAAAAVAGGRLDVRLDEDGDPDRPGWRSRSTG